MGFAVFYSLHHWLLGFLEAFNLRILKTVMFILAFPVLFISNFLGVLESPPFNIGDNLFQYFDFPGD